MGAFSKTEKVIEKVEIKVEKFDGDAPQDGEPDTRVLRERAFIVDGTITKIEYFDEVGNYVTTIEGGK
jgi:hypothetical protein